MADLRIELRYFARVRELLGRRAETRHVPPGTTIGHVWAALVAECPNLGTGVPVFRPSVNQEYTDTETILADGDEVAFIPPVSGGSDAPPRLCRLTHDPIDANELVAAVWTPADGAICTFHGIVREDSRNRTVRYLEYDAYPAMAEKKMAEILDEVTAKWPKQRVAIVHRLGVVPLGAASVVIAVASPHRSESFEACRYVIDRVKEVVPIWKKEVFTDGEEWIEGS
jgi:molybdopterin synthase catalytic subunit